MTGEESVEEAASLAPHLDAVLLDSGDPSLRVKELGGLGRIHDWGMSRRIREAVGVPVILAGDWIPETWPRLSGGSGPTAVDICSSVRTGGRLDESKLGEFFKGVTDGLRP